MNTIRSLIHRKREVFPEYDLGSEEEYIYDQLDPTNRQIRLLRLRQDRTGPIQCNMQIVSIARAPPYRALSYEWGSADSLRRIRVNGAVLNIRQNLWAFLNMYRARPQNEGYLWIDQICINQNNLEERSNQVQLMKDLYREATSVVVWLGYTDDPRLSRIGKQLAATSEHPLGKTSWARIGHREPNIWPIGQCLICRRNAVDKILCAFISLTYWRRLWIIQELALARHTTFHLGPQQIENSHLRTTLAKFFDPQRPEMGPIRLFEEVAYVNFLLALNKSGAEEIWSTLYMIYREDTVTHCSDPHDLIYGLLGIVSTVPGLRVDYSLPTEEIFGGLLNSLVCDRGGSLKKSWLPAFFMADPMASLAVRLGIPPHWCKVLQIVCEISPTSGNFEYVALEDETSRRTQSAFHIPDLDLGVSLKRVSEGPAYHSLRGFLGCLSILNALDLDKTNLSLNDILTVMIHVMHLYGLQRWVDMEWDLLDEVDQGEALHFFVKLTPRVKAFCTEKGIIFRLPHVRWDLQSSFTDEQMEELMQPIAKDFLQGVPVLAHSDCTSCSQPIARSDKHEE